MYDPNLIDCDSESIVVKTVTDESSQDIWLVKLSMLGEGLEPYTVMSKTEALILAMNLLNAIEEIRRKEDMQ